MKATPQPRSRRDAPRSAFVTPGDERYYSVTPTPIGSLLLVGDGEALVELGLPDSGQWEHLGADHVRDDALLEPAAQQIAAYFEGDLADFSIPLAPRGTPFQSAVWGALLDIAYGTTATYGEIAASVGRPKASRAVGMANHVNPIALVIPCHRVIGANGALTGYGGGLALKAALLEFEADVVAGRRQGFQR
jgi:methylated-DNA-[protein]-cysteine S-methyltransferase